MIKNYDLFNKIYYNKIVEKIPIFFIKRILKKLNIYFTFSPLNILPDLNHPILHSFQKQKKYLNNFKITNKQTSFMTCPYLIQLLSVSFKKNENFNFLDFGGENIDFYLELKKEFENVRYYVFNQKEVLENLNKLKDDNNLKDFNIIFDISEIYKNNYEFINFGSSIQYFNNYEKILNDIIKVSKKYIFFSGIHFYISRNDNLKKHLIVKQVNLLPKVLFCYFFNREYFLNLFSGNKYFIIFEKKNFTDNVNYKNFSRLFDSIEYKDILFCNN